MILSKHLFTRAHRRAGGGGRPMTVIMRSKHYPTLFRVLRPDENGSWIRAARKKDGRPIKDKALDHVTDGSSSAYSSSLISCTSELEVALAFGGILSRIAVIDPLQIPDKDVEYLDKEYLRKACFTDRHAISRSRRSDEVIVDTSIPLEHRLNVRVLECKREICPGFAEDGSFFPAPELFEEPQGNPLTTISRLGGANKRLFRVGLGDERFVARPPRPNVCLDRPILFDSDLVTQCRHEFSSYCAYRNLALPTSLVPKCALYTFKLKYDAVPNLLPTSGVFEWGMILMENLKQLSISSPPSEQIRDVATRLFGADLLLGNWGCADGEGYESFAENFIYAKRPSDHSVVRVAVDRGLGNTYPEDNQKPYKVPIHFGESTSDLRVSLLQQYKYLYGHLDEQTIAQNIMDLGLDQPENIEQIEECLASTDWPSFVSNKKSSILDIVRCRSENLLATLPYHKLPIAPGLRPEARDGHAAVAFPDEDEMIIMGGYTARGPVEDVWKLQLPSPGSTPATWEKMKNIPGGPRFSFSAHSWEINDSRFIVIFGGGNKKPVEKAGPMHGDLLLFDVDNNEWLSLSFPVGAAISPRCRYSSTWHVSEGVGTATLHIIGGHDEEGKRKDVYRVVLNHVSGSIPTVASCERMNDLPTALHRAFAFQLGDGNRILSIGGLGKGIDLRKIQIVQGRGSGKSIPTHGSLDAHLPIDLSGFGAVVDGTDNRVVLLGGGQIKTQGEEQKSLGDSMGWRAPAQEQPFRVLCLCRELDGEGREEWIWKVDKNHEQLEESFRLPVRTSWSACLMNHKIILFGGRHGDDFSNETIVLQLRPSYVNATEEIQENTRAIRCILDGIKRKWGDDAEQEARHEISRILGNKVAQEKPNVTS